MKINKKDFYLDGGSFVVETDEGRRNSFRCI
jgi:hypothetical protein